MFSAHNNRPGPALRITVAVVLAASVTATAVPTPWAVVSGAIGALAFIAACAIHERRAVVIGAYVAALEARRIARLVVAPRRGAHAAPARLIPTQRTRIGAQAVTA